MKTVVILPERLDSPAQAVLLDSLEHCITGDVWLDASGVDLLGARCAEILLSASRTAASKGGMFAVLEASERFNEHLGYLGLTPADLQTAGA